MSFSIDPIRISLSQSELKVGALTQRNLEIATRALHRDGMIIIEKLIPEALLDKLNEKMVKDAYELQARKDSPCNFNKGYVQQDPPLTADWFSEEIYFNSIVTQVTSTTLGPFPLVSFISGNTAFPPATTSLPTSQPTQTDAAFDHLDLPFSLVVNIPLTTMTPENGSTELWLGTHSITTLGCQEGVHGDRASGRIKTKLIEERKKVRGPCQPVVARGSVVIRDLRIWYRDMPNLSNAPRIMLTLLHFAPWYRNTMQVEFAEELRPLVWRERIGLRVAARFLTKYEAEKRYLNRPFSNVYGFDQQKRIEGIF
ncbi:phytanoyl-CoA dioxygenase family protein [Glonium stellatum]|uniref:Phytanoyl-CoA dioxygenase family protein n=1 Tax=Glonium stellatum TaxID=574774 RepID=A0A8E2JQK3_9PEZI|nr:phytanoyl-CoA dioxygenase family protein [Glonium stellatum]